MSGARIASAFSEFLARWPLSSLSVGRGVACHGGWYRQSSCFRGLWELGTWEAAKNGNPPGPIFPLGFQASVEI